MKFLRKNLYKTILFFVILYILIDLSIPFDSFNYPYALTLSDGNIFVIHQKGVTICNKHLTRILKNVENMLYFMITFSELLQWNFQRKIVTFKKFFSIRIVAIRMALSISLHLAPISICPAELTLLISQIKLSRN